MKYKILAIISYFTLIFCPSTALSRNRAIVTEDASNLKRPNIVFILADDMGYGDPKCYNPESKIATPNLDNLIHEGIKFTDAHTPGSVCTPTRYGLVTGRYCWRSRLKRGVLNGYGTPLIEKERQTIGTLLKKSDYTTGIVGKWHLGLGFQKDEQGKFDFSKPVNHCPNDLGFDYSYIIPASLDFPPYVYIKNGDITEYPGKTHEKTGFPAYTRTGEQQPGFIFEEVLDHLLGKAQGFVKKHSKNKNPFFLYFPMTAPHKPLLPHPRFIGESGHSLYGDFIHQVDWTVGELLKTLDEEGIAENTLVIFTSDNGSYMYSYNDGRKDHIDSVRVQGFRVENHRANGILRGTKADIYEGGHRVPFIVRWPGVVQQNSKNSKTICLTDILATLADITNTEFDTISAKDSYSFLPLLTGNTRDYQREPVIHHSINGMFAIRDGTWKLILGNGSGGREKPKGKKFKKPYMLFNLNNDIEEKKNLVDKYSETAKKLENKCLGIIGKDF